MNLVIERVNPMGLRFILTQVTGVDKTIVNFRDKQLTLDMSIDEVSQCWYNWQMKGEYIQDAFRALPAEQREFLMTGITPYEWDEIFKGEEQ